MNFITACRDGDIKSVRKIIFEKDINIHDQDDLAFRWIIKNNHLDILKYLVFLEDNKKKLRTMIHLDNDFYFYYACKEGYIDIVKYLIYLEPDEFRLKKMIMYNKDEIFINTYKNGHIEIVKYLIQIYEEKDLENVVDDYSYDSYYIKYIDIIKSFLYITDEKYIEKFDFRFFDSAISQGCMNIAKWIVQNLTNEKLQKIRYCYFVSDELERRRKSKFLIFLHLTTNSKFKKLLDMRALSDIWKFL